jgi:hypothetical protein
MTKDPIVEEVHRARAKLLASCGGNLDRLMDKLAKQESRHKALLVATPALRGKKRFTSSH